MGAGNGQRIAAEEATATVDSGSTAMYSKLTAQAGCWNMGLYRMGCSFFIVATIPAA